MLSNPDGDDSGTRNNESVSSNSKDAMSTANKSKDEKSSMIPVSSMGNTKKRMCEKKNSSPLSFRKALFKQSSSNNGNNKSRSRSTSRLKDDAQAANKK